MLLSVGLVGEMPLISICIPTYNRSRFLKRCLDNILNQGGFDENIIDIVISDNASSDSTQSLAHEYQKKCASIRYFRNQENIGANLNLFRAAEHATGEYIRFMGDDDQIADGGLQQVIHAIKTHHDVVLLHTNMTDWGILVQDGIHYFKDLLRQNKASKLLIFLTYLSALIVKRDIFLQYLNEFRAKFPHKLKESYGHFYVFIRCLYKQNIALLGDIIIGGVGDEKDKNYRRNSSKKRYDIVITNGVDKIYEDKEFLDSIGISEKELDVFKYNFLKIYKMVKISCFMKRIGLYKPLLYIFKKFIFKHI